MDTLLLQEELTELHARDLYRKIRTLERIDSVRALLNGRETHLFCGNDYLGLTGHPKVIRAFKQASDEYGVGSGAARLISGSTVLHERLETRLAEFKGKERALLFTTGYLANLGILTALAGEKDLIVLDKLCHASIIDGARLSGATLRVFPHKNYERCREILEKSAGYRRRLLVTDGVFSMDGDLADVSELVALKEAYDCLLVVDDAHGTGVVGPTGRGISETLAAAAKIDVMMGTLSKAIGCLGGFAACSNALRDYLINFSRPFIFATSLPPALCAAALEALNVIENGHTLRERLWKNVAKIHAALSELGFAAGPATSPIFPVILGDEKKALRVSDALLKEGFLVPAIRPPTVPKGKARLRLTVSAAHSNEAIDGVLTALRKAR